VNICILGATGRVGSLILSKALNDGHEVQALVRNSGIIPFQHPKLKWVIGNALDKEHINEVLRDVELVISALNTDGNSTLSRSIPIIIDTMKISGISRIVTIGTAGILQSRLQPELYRFQSTESRNRSTKAAEDHLLAYHQLKESDLDWTIVCPTYLPDGNQTGSYRTEKDFLPNKGLSISTADTAEFAYNQLFSTKFLKCRVGISY